MHMEGEICGLTRTLARCQGCNSGQFLPLQKLEGGAPSGRNKSHLSRDTELFDRRYRIPGSNDGFRT
jgi:hypothetical protein